MRLTEFLKNKKPKKYDSVVINGQAFEAQRLWQFLRACRKISGLKVYTDNKELKITWPQGQCTFRPWPGFNESSKKGVAEIVPHCIGYASDTKPSDFQTLDLNT